MSQSIPSTGKSRVSLLKRGLWLEGLTVGYNVLEGIIAGVAGWLAGSVALVGFGIDSGIETISAVMVSSSAIGLGSPNRFLEASS